MKIFLHQKALKKFLFQRSFFKILKNIVLGQKALKNMKNIFRSKYFEKIKKKIYAELLNYIRKYFGIKVGSK